MAKRIVTKIGDIFCVEVDNDYKCFFQYIANDMTVLNSSVIRVFLKHYPMDYVPVFDDIVKDEVYFYAHTILRFGILYNAWYKAGKHPDVGNPNEIMFRWTYDVGPIKKSYEWHFWKINQEPQFIGEMREEYVNYDLGIVFTYDDIVSKIKTGKFILKHID
jgi:hypothetical protein